MKTEDRNIRGTDGSVALGGDRKSLTITVVGAGYVGLVTAACLAEWGHRVVCIDADTSKIAALKVGKIHFYEPDLSELVLSNVSAGRLTFDTAIERAVSQSEVVFLAVGTPARASDGHADMSQVYSAARDVARGLRDFTVIVTKSTVPVGTGDEIERIVSRARPDASFSVVSNPEFLREGTAVSDFLNPDRVVIGTSSQSAINLMTTVYDRLSQSRTRIVFAERRTAELIKYAANAFLATRISFINEIADLCERVGADVKDVALGMGLDSRIGNSFLAAGPG
ncbi:MAG: UDP-glucose/GDP-mannose dehydrogenase family protein, partial [Rhizobiaceae bacterium]|nr:UDP-glucose/GDP-mannose dehydrogenase family protein [Rhizobiaceae bacterium]